MLHFGAARDAVLAASTIVADVAAAGLPDAHVGIAAGPLIARDGDFFGHTVNLAARLTGRATAGRILVDAVVREAIGERASVRFSAAGSFDLKGISQPVPAWWATVDEPV